MYTAGGNVHCAREMICVRLAKCILLIFLMCEIYFPCHACGGNPMPLFSPVTVMKTPVKRGEGE